MTSYSKCLLVLLTLFLTFSANAQGTYGGEFHHGFGGFSVKLPDEPTSRQNLSFELDDYIVWGDLLTWKTKNIDFSISFCSVITRSRTNSMITEADKPIVIGKWRTVTLKQLSDAKLAAAESPYSFESSRGIELRVSGAANSIRRIFFLKSRIFVLTLSARTASDLITFGPILESFRRLNRIERTLAMLEESRPPTLVQERPKVLPLPDSIDLGLQGPVRRIRETKQSNGQKDPDFIQEVHFDEKGFLLLEISFNDGFPDVITSWGWVSEQRVNLQSAINYPDFDGPRTPRSQIVSGLQFLPGQIYDPKYFDGPIRNFGNRFVTKFDDKNRLLERFRYSNTGALAYVERYSYDGSVRTKKTTDDRGGFIGGRRERLDDHNNVVEVQILSDSGGIVESSEIEYKFDIRGNWIEKTVFRKMPVGKRIVRKPAGTFYRKIQYFESSDSRQVG